ncbi:DNA mismatch repair ATPase MutS [Pedobacter cryoconitis]|uniref:MutS-related protein n=1 Tax=Pedobacter cryoconitis TaxID=188932 RepID=UPI001615D8E1|nr:DNA mismatch repair protein [Pedobacter cryoconitis]MBB6271878.1 DNA mismatch repair ATPase MutS [Pedobacter cryoconitis]
MKYLLTDEQTISDLSIFDKQGKTSIYTIFNKTKTQGGAHRLEMIFKHPWADAHSINKSAMLYRFFSQKEFVYPVDPITIGIIAFYLENNDVRTQIKPSNESLGEKLRNMVSTDADRQLIEDGVQACLRVFYQLDIFLRQEESKAISSPYQEQFQQLKQIVYHNSFEELRSVMSKHESKLDTIRLAELDKRLRFDHRELILQVLELLYDLDVYIAVGQVARNRKFCFGKALPESKNFLHLKQVFHPALEQPIANDLNMDDKGNLIFLTGANMAGKSTLMKSIGLSLYLGHMGFPVPAESMEFAVRDGIFTNINLADNLSAGASHFYAEVLRVKEIAKTLQSGKRLFVIFDELFRGTNVKDAYDGTIELTRAFCRKSESQFIISTHIMEAGEVLLKENLSIQYLYLPTIMEGNYPKYTRVLKTGITDDRQGMIIINNEGILEMLEAGLKKQNALWNS